MKARLHHIAITHFKARSDFQLGLDSCYLPKCSVLMSRKGVEL